MQNLLTEYLGIADLSKFEIANLYVQQCFSEEMYKFLDHVCDQAEVINGLHNQLVTEKAREAVSYIVY